MLTHIQSSLLCHLTVLLLIYHILMGVPAVNTLNSELSNSTRDNLYGERVAGWVLQNKTVILSSLFSNNNNKTDDK